MAWKRWFAGGLAVALVVSAAVVTSVQQAGAENPASCDHRSVAVRNDDLRCVVQFGLPGESWDPPGGAGGVTRDRNQPSLISIRSGTTVEFQSAGRPHVVAVYDHGLNKNGTTNNLTTFRDITYVSGQPGVIADVDGRLALGVQGESLDYTFTEPGQYLVICAFRAHFEDFGQATYVVVDETVTEAP